ncbi:hypothetical protein [Flaviaesturariibacter aridisoli]|uniref:Uncharacterized protein n=1 Tax=Flaviaesturariibacter aridisoli TaxID=2545761 RepID=A0A4R4DVT1_9BACT|nr:hypothetical protein [Flaviaesturariibacter aridisoli]TCZ64714.1 hypothetical protein E0486_18020 [Flaviaesturariibacter aridisoli]
MRFSFLLLALLGVAPAFAQNPKVPDSTLNKVCQALATSRQLSDSSKVVEALGLHLLPVLQDLGEDDFRQAYYYAFIRLQRNCPEFARVVARLAPQKGDWQEVPAKPVSEASADDCKAFRKYPVLAYLESSGDTVRAVLRDGYWEDRFPDGTYSRLKMRWLSGCEFQIEFVESNNPARASYSKPGDKYNYGIVRKEPGYFLMSVTADDHKQYSTFKLYY